MYDTPRKNIIGLRWFFGPKTIFPRQTKLYFYFKVLQKDSLTRLSVNSST